jgi:hypothetical protein
MTRTVLAAVSAGVAALGLTACVAIPTSGPVQQGVEVGVAASDQVIRVIARPPQPNMTPTEIVSGFLQASASFEDDHAIARQFLTPQAATTWNPETGVTVYEGVPTIVPDGVSAVDMTATKVGAIDADGRFEVSTSGSLVVESLPLEFVSGNWRISGPPPGLLLSRSDVDRAFRAYDVYFLDPTFTTLVPDPRYFAIAGPTPATALARALVQGPTEWLAPAVRTGLPDGTDLAVDAVPVVDGVARVDLSPEVRLADVATRQAISAQLSWTLRQVAGVRSIDLNAGGQVLDVDGTPNPQPLDAWPEYNPDALPDGSRSFGVLSGRVVTLDGVAPLPVAGASGVADPPLDGIAISLTGDRIAGLDADGRMWLGRIDTGGELTSPWEEPGQSRPSFGGGEAPWVVGPDGVLRRIDDEERVVVIPVDGLHPKAVLESISLSRDGTRAALTVRRGPRTFIMLAIVTVREGNARVEKPVRVDNRLTTVVDVVWGGADTLVALGLEGASSSSTVYEIDLGRWQVRSLGNPPSPVRLAAAPDSPTLASTDQQRIWSYTTGPWQSGPRGGSPAYPGS